jgi:hypothetical protein
VKSFKVSILLVAVFFVLTFKLVANEIITNEAIITMVKAGLGEELIVSKIQTSQSQFDVSIETILKLKKEGISEKIIKAMVDASAKDTPISEVQTDKELQSLPAKGDMFLLRNGKFIEMDSVPGYTEASFKQGFKQLFGSPKNKFAIIAEDTKAKFRINEQALIFYTRYNPNELGIVKFTVQHEKKRRYIFIVHLVGSNRGEFFPKEDAFDIDSEKLTSGIYKITLKKPLISGEYGIIAPLEKSYLIYDFGIE